MRKVSWEGPRWATAAVGLPVLIGVCLWGEVPFTVFTILLALIARSELHHAYARLGVEPNGLLTLLGAVVPGGLILFRPLYEGLTISASLPLLLILACSLVMASFWETGRASHVARIHTGSNIAFGLLCGAYASLFGGIALLRTCTWHGPNGLFPTVEGGALIVLVTLSCTIASDSSAYFVGRVAGHHKLAEGLSQKKTTEGLLGGILGSILAGSAAGTLLLGSPFFGLVIGVLAGLLGPLGDLFKSALKREIGIKDFGTILPGHGGILDRFDSLLFTAPVVVLLATTIETWP
jgi:phosphatidate cytidylyltransferase